MPNRPSISPGYAASPSGLFPLPLGLAVVVAVAVAVGPTPVAAQTGGPESGWNLQQRGGLALAVEDFGDADLGVGYGIQLTGGYQFPQRIGLYAGWTWFRFNTDDSFAGPDVEVDESGFMAGLRYEHPIRIGTPATLQLQLGTVYDEVELESGDGTLIATSDRDFAWAASAGIEFPLGEGWRFGPALRFRSLSPGFEVGGIDVKTDLTHLSVDLGLSQRF